MSGRIADAVHTLLVVVDAAPALQLALEIAVAATALIVIASLAVRAARRQGAATRHVIWSVAVVGLLAVPLLRASLPEWYLTSTRPRAAEASPGIAASEVLGSGAVRQGAMAPEVDRPPTDGANASSAPAVVVALDRFLVPVWAAGTGVVMLWLCGGIVAIGAVIRRAEEIDDPELLDAAGEAARDVGGVSRARLRWSDEVEVPVVAGLVRPVILVPRSARGWSPERMRWTLVHELAHVRRHDVAIGILSRLACAVYWFHPAVWHVAARIDVERERACDELVASLRGDPLGYADELLRAAAAAFDDRRLPGFLPAGAPSALEERIEGLLDRPSRVRQPGVRDVVGGLALSLIVAAPLAAATLSPPPDDTGSTVELSVLEQSAAELSSGDGSVAGFRPDTVAAGSSSVTRWEYTLDAIDRDREIFLAAAAEMTRAVSRRISSEAEPGLDDAAVRWLLHEAAEDLWNHLSIEVWTPRDAPDGLYASVGVQGESHLSMRSWDGDRRIARVSTRSGPFSSALPDAVFRRLPTGVTGEDPGLRRELASAGERLAAFWEAYLERMKEI